MNFKYILKITLFFILILVIILGIIFRDFLSAKYIITRMSAKYRSCLSLEDKGVVKELIITDKVTISMETPYTLWFKRPNLFRVEWIDQFHPGGKKYRRVFCANDKIIYRFTEPDKYEVVDTLGHGIAMITPGIRAANTIADLLVPLCGFSVTDLKRPKVIKHDIVNGVKCYLIRGKHPLGYYWYLWIGCKDYLLWKHKVKYEESDFLSINEEIHETVILNTNISKEIFYDTPTGIRIEEIRRIKEQKNQ